MYFHPEGQGLSGMVITVEAMVSATSSEVNIQASRVDVKSTASTGSAKVTDGKHIFRQSSSGVKTFVRGRG